MAASRVKLLRGRASGLSLGLAIVMVAAFLQFFGAFDGLERRAYDLRFLMRGEKTPHPDILLVTIDEATRRTLGKATGAITRREYAQLIDNLAESGARVVTFDLDLATPRNGDKVLARSIACSGKVILSSFLAMGDWVRANPLFRDDEIACAVDDSVMESSGQVAINEESTANIEWKPKPGLTPSGFRVYYSVVPFDDPESIPSNAGGFVDVNPEENSLELTIEGIPAGTILYTAVRGLLFGSYLGEGAVNIIEDPDAKVRSLPVIVARSRDDPEKKAALSVESAVRYLFSGEPKLVKSTLWELTFGEADERFNIPLIDGRMIINYRGGRDTYPRLSFGDVLNGKFDPEKVRGKVVLLGNTHQLAHDEYPTPFGMQKISGLDTPEEGISTGYTSGLEIHANALDTVLSRDFIMPLSGLLDKAIFKKRSDESAVSRLRLWDAALVLTVGILAVILLLVLRLSLPAGAFVFASIILIVLLAGYVAFSAANIWIPLAGPLLTTVAVYAGGLLHQARVQEREKTWIKETFGKYLAPAVVEEITRNPSMVELGGIENELTAYFSDIQGFSTISEELGDAKLLVTLLNEYLSVMADVIEEYGGTIDKYEGDAVMAFWGAPIHFPDHAARACHACLDMQEQLDELRKRWRAEDKWPDLVKNMRVRMGMNTGLMVVGNMGSEGRMNYTVMGDAVNLASRLEGANKAYKTYNMISHDTYKKVKSEFEARYLDLITVVGKSEPVKVYELMSRKGGLDERTLKMIEIYDRGIEKYTEREWEAAISDFEDALKIIPEDGPSLTYVERCKRFVEDPPPPDWNGVFKLESK